MSEQVQQGKAAQRTGEQERKRPPREKGDAEIDVSVLVPVLNEEQHIKEAVGAMRAQRFEGEVELLFMDGGSTDATRSILQQLAAEDSRVRLLDNPRRRTTFGLNIGLKKARGRFIARMDAHTIYPRDYLARGVERLERGDVDWVTGPQIPAGSGRWSRRVALALATPLGRGGSRKWSATREIELDTGVFTGVWNRDTLDRLGGWDEGWPVNQDSELAARVISAGGRIVCVPQMGARYTPRDDLRALARQYWRYGFYRAKTSRRHPDSMRRSHLLAPGLVATLALATVGPSFLRRRARLLLGTYALALTVVASAQLRENPADDAAMLPAVFVAMHTAWGVGFICGCMRFGVPVEALRRLVAGGDDTAA